jgi:hypothetical protein
MAYALDFPAIARTSAWVGPAHSGAHEALFDAVDRAVRADDGDVLVLVPRASAVATMRAKLAQRLGDAARGVRVSTPRAEELAVLGTPAAREALGRGTHLLADFERTFFLEDMKVTGIKSRRLREMLKFFSRSITELADRDPGWLITVEERETHAFAQDVLRFMGSIHPVEMSNAAATALEANPELRAQAGATHVFVSHYEAANRASQLFCHLIARAELGICFDEHGAIEAEDPYPYAAGLNEFRAAHPDAHVQRFEDAKQDPRVARVVRHLLAQPCMRDEAAAPAAEDAGAAYRSETDRAPLSADDLPIVRASSEDGTCCTRLVAAGPREEFTEAARFVAGKVASGTRPEDVFVAVPNRTWGRFVTRALQQEDVPASYVGAAQALRGDVRSLDASRALQFACGLALAADPTDACAWRCWCGFGDYLGASAGMHDLRIWAGDAGISLPCALGALDAGEAPHVVGADGICARYRAGRALTEACKGRAGEDLLAAVSKEVGLDKVPDTVRTLIGTAGAADTARDLVERLHAALYSPAFASGAVRVGAWTAAAGQDPRGMVICGFMNGFTPPRAYFDLSQMEPAERERTWRSFVEGLYALTACTRDEIACSTFEQAPLEDAERLNLKVKRVKLVDGVRTCVLEPSLSLAALEGE